MTTAAKPRSWKRGVLTGLVVVLLLDGVLLVVNWRAARASMHSQREQAARLNRQADQLASDVTRAEAIRGRIPQVKQNSDRFYADQFLPAATGYSSIVAELGELAGHSGLKTGGISFKQKELEKRGVTEIQISASVEGDYPSLIHFINGLERSKNFYLLDDLRLASVTTGSIKLQLELRTYFRD
jgi:Tfp pilus assembly protein PilO